jgi:hypothetical protein
VVSFMLLGDLFHTYACGIAGKYPDMAGIDQGGPGALNHGVFDVCPLIEHGFTSYHPG